KSWTALVELRNCIVHNNAVADNDFAFELSNGVNWVFVKGQPIVATLRHFPLTIRWALEAYARWCDRVLSVCKSGAQVKQG
ncbi:hypothetical protein, partial [Pseudomonas nitroreducens]|uniref:hypothetical protein n=1 Tax=Pseudomonas nitroreducens TaxID=46680 RepID=UPI003D29DEC0